MNRRWLAVGGLAVAAVATLSCQLILGLEEPVGVPAGTEEMPPPDEDAGPKDPCRHASKPAPPKKDDDLDTKKSYWFATKAVFGPLTKYPNVAPGYDLDNACTCAPDLHDGGPSCNASKIVCDLDGGIDDTVGALFGEVSSSFIDPLKPVNSSLQSGARTLLLYMADYNGKPNDSDVRVAFINSGGLYTKVGCDGTERELEMTLPRDGTHTPSDKDRWRPLFDGCDNWSPEANGLLNGSRIPNQLTKGYVTNNQLVINVDQLGTAVFGNNATIYSPALVATISHEGDPDHLKLEGVFAGRLPFDDMVQALGGNQVGDGFADGGYTAVCESSFWLLAGPKLCGARDIMATDNEDFTGRACNATSLNFGFTLVESKLADFDFTNPSVQKMCPKLTCP